MDKLFGVPINQMLVYLLVVLAIGAAVMIVAALRNPVLFKMGVRNITRRPAQTSLIILGLMLTTLLFSSALSTGDTMNYSIRKSALDLLGPVDEVVQAKSISNQESMMMNQTGKAQTNGQYFGPDTVGRIRETLAPTGLVDGVAPVVSQDFPAVSPDSKQTLPKIRVLGVEQDYARQTEPLRTAAGQELDVGSLTPASAFLNTKAADKLDVHEGDKVQLFSSTGPRVFSVAGIYDSGGKTGQTGAESMVMPVTSAQTLTGTPGMYNMVMISNQGDMFTGVDKTGEIIAALDPAIAGSNLEVRPLKQTALDNAQTAASEFTSIFLLFGEFSMVAGILLIFLIFVMLAAERKTELGVMRAMGSKRRDILKVFAFEGVVYSALAAAVGALLGVAVGWGMVQILASAFGSFEEFSFSFSFNIKSLAIAYAMGMIATFVIVVVSAWRAGRINIVRAIRDIPEPQKGGRRQRWLAASIAMLALGVLITMAGLRSNQAGPFTLGVSFLIVGVPFLLRYFGLPDRIAFSIAGIGLLLWWLLPEKWIHKVLWFLPEGMNAGMEMFILSGIAVVAGAIWTVMYNSDILLAGIVAIFGRVKSLPPILKISVNYPMRTRFRTGMALAMFSLIIFTMTFMAAMMLSISALYDDIPRVSGGFQIQGMTGYSNPVKDVQATLASRGDGTGSGDYTAIGSLASQGTEIRQADAGQDWSEFVIQGADAGYLDNVNYTFKLKDPAYKNDADVWQAIKNQPGLAVVHTSLLPAKSNFQQGGPPNIFKMSGVYQEDTELPGNLFLEVKDPVSGRVSRLKVIGVIEPLAYYAQLGIFTSQETLAGAFSRPAPPASFWFRTAPGVNAGDASKALQRTFYANGMTTNVIEDTIRSSMRAMNMIDNLLTGFMGLGLIVGIAALGVIAARAVVERRQQIGMLRAIGFRRSMVQKAFLLESSFVAILGITIGTALGLMLCYSVMDFMSGQMEGLTYKIPWLNVGFIALLAYAASLLTTYLPARQASRVYPAEALRYE